MSLIPGLPVLLGEDSPAQGQLAAGLGGRVGSGPPLPNPGSGGLMAFSRGSGARAGGAGCERRAPLGSAPE